MNKLRGFISNRFFWYSCLLSFFVMTVYFFNFYQQARAGTDLETDTYWHLQYVRWLYEDGSLPPRQQGYPLFFIIVYVFFRIFGNMTIAAMLFCMIWSFATNMIQIYFISHFTEQRPTWYAILAGSALSFVWPLSARAIDIFKGLEAFHSSILSVYLTSGASAPYQSLSYLCTKPFALLSVLFFIEAFEDDSSHQQNKRLIIFSVMLFLSVLAKPNFYQAFAPAGVIIVIVHFFSNHGKVFWKCCKYALAYIPATIWVIYTMTLKVEPIVFAPFEAINWYNGDELPVVVLLGRGIIYAAFVLICTVYYRQMDRLTWTGIATYLAGTIEWLTLNLSESRATLDIMWGYNIGIYVLFSAMVIEAYRYRDKKCGRSLLGIGNVIIACHALTGILMFITWYPYWVDYFTILFG